jgi:putative sigma-54 modulation protein
MPIEITARHMQATPAIQDYARRKAEALVEEFPRLEHIHVILDVEKHRQLAEVVVQGKRRASVESRASAARMPAAIDTAVANVEKQLRRSREKTLDHKTAMKARTVLREARERRRRAGA